MSETEAPKAEQTPTDTATTVPSTAIATVLLGDSGQESGQEQPNNTGKGDYAIGYGKPPKGVPWVKGQSGNPKGRPSEVMSKEEIIHEARRYGPEALETVVALMRGVDVKTAGKMALALLGIAHDIGPGAKKDGTQISVNVGTGGVPAYWESADADDYLTIDTLAQRRQAGGPARLMRQRDETKWTDAHRARYAQFVADMDALDRGDVTDVVVTPVSTDPVTG